VMESLVRIVLRGCQLPVEVSILYTRLSHLFAAVDGEDQERSTTERISHAATTLEYTHIRRRAAILELHALAEASAARNNRGDDVSSLGYASVPPGHSGVKT
jgi:hypothetical protein